jgi:hypothetical protein
MCVEKITARALRHIAGLLPDVQPKGFAERAEVGVIPSWVEVRSQTEVLAHSELGIHRHGFGEHPDRGSYLGTRVPDVGALPPHYAVVRLQASRHCAHRGAFAGAVGPDQRHALAGVNLDAHRLQPEARIGDAKAL